MELQNNKYIMYPLILIFLIAIVLVVNIIVSRTFEFLSSLESVSVSVVLSAIGLAIIQKFRKN